MGSYSNCWLDDILIGFTKNDIDVNLITLFRQQDKVVASAPFLDLPSHLQRYQEHLDEDPDLKLVYYEAPIRFVCDRLELLGYDLNTAKEAFRLFIEQEKEQRLEWFNGSGDDVSDDTQNGWEMQIRKEVEILDSLSPEIWIDNIKKIRNSGIIPEIWGRYKSVTGDIFVDYMLSKEWMGYPGYDMFVPIRLAMEAYDDGKSLIYDMTELVWYGEFDYEYDFVELGVNYFSALHGRNSKIIVLTEGKTDAWILSDSLSFLYPHLKDYFSFLDFEISGFGGGVGNLVNVVKAFAGAGIVNDVIALFDNDTAAAVACREIRKINLPQNIAVLHLPNIAMLERYPTLGPSGLVHADVNGIAASIELYLGEDVLKINEENFMPIQWTGYDKSIRKYQGEVLNKQLLHVKFKEKLENAKMGSTQDWKGLEAIFQQLFKAFSDRNKQFICDI
jgi:hypothetical protein